MGDGKRQAVRRWFAVPVILAIAVAGLLGCGKASSGGNPAMLGNTKGAYHVPGWLAVHPGAAIQNLSSCTSCHELSSLKTSGGAPSCATTACHHATIPGFAVPGSHGLRAKQAQDTSGGGLVSCQLCHGSDFLGGPTGRACATCHGVRAPHPVKPWRGTLTHATTDPSNAAVCVQCHAAGSPNNPAGHPSAPAPSGAMPSCFNNTMCHDNKVAPHPLGPIWRDANSSAFHGLEAKKDLSYCQSCHGTPGTTRFDGGVAATACSSCHTAAGAHSKPWYKAPVSSFPGYVPSHRNAGNRSVACAICHDVVRSRTAPNPAAPSCFSDSRNGVGCHANGPGEPNHPVPYLDTPHTTATQASFNGNCGSCHAVSGTSPTAAPTCVTCHQAGSPLNLGNCTSCHAKPPAGSSFPDNAGKHAKHEALAGIGGACSVCHSGVESGTLAHYDHANGRPGSDALRTPPAPVATQATFHAKAGAASFNPATLTCSNVSCHGGKTTPSWQNGIIDSNADAGCRACHALGTALGVPENNSPYSGTHALHLGTSVNALCTDCHAMNNGTTGAANHFKFLGTPQMEGPASDTVAPMGNPSYYKPSNQTCGTFTCHGHLHTNSNWNGGPNHPIPYLGSPHTTTTQSSFDLDCKNCHAVSVGPSPIAAAPTCATCHQAGSPLNLSNCTSCHAKPPVGASFPDVAGKHAKHDALATVSGVCSSCHESFDSGTQAHYDHANARPGKDALRVPPAPFKASSDFNAKGGAAGFDPATLTCSNVSCHGGLRTPSWQNGTIDPLVDAGCRSCHSLGTALGVPENNSLYSGLHAYHLGTTVNALCTECHNMGNSSAGAANHFKFLRTPQMEGPAAGTVEPMGNPSYYNAVNQTCGTFTCHGHLHGGSSWSGGPNHPIPYLDAKHTGATQASFDSDCKNCHAATGASSPLANAPTCVTCHQAGSPLTLTNCTSCHAKPPVGTAFPDVAGKHAKHNALAGVSNACSACHTGSESGTQAHYDHANARPGHNGQRVPPAPVTAASSYNAKAGAASFDPTALTCSNVSCHGGIATPSWATGTINSTADSGCVQCHKLGTALGVPEANSHYSGMHAQHLAASVGAVCSDCHGMANGTNGANNHFKFLGTAAMEGPASDTVQPMGNPAYYQAGAQTCGNFTCHGQLHSNYSWKGGPNHPVPFLATPHTTTSTQAGFDSSCGGCHAVSGTSPMALAPTCSECHQGGSPLSLSNCTSCHAKPPTGTAFPNVAGKHAKHDALAGVTSVCAACHTGSDSGSQSHYDHANGRAGHSSLRVPPAPVAGASTYNAKAGAATFNPTTLTCSNVSCHGAITTPSWATGTINSTTDAGCVLCHKPGTALGVPESNSYYSGMHSFHLGLQPPGGPVVCSDCHGMANGTNGANNHFRFLGTAAMEGPASDTVQPMGNPAYYQAGTQSCGNFTCHGQLHSNYNWKGGANHSVPFLSPSHTSVNNATAFASNCGGCHADTGTNSPMSLAPTCVTCHTAGTPLTLANCTSCHAKPPASTTFPNVASTHPVHNGLAGVANNCDACHTGVGTGTQLHYDHANNRPGSNSLRVPPGEVAVSATYNAKTGAATFSTTALTCSNVSCHGGQATPAWSATASIAANCTACHVRGTAAATPQYNAYYSGHHAFHMAAGFQGGPAVCSDCHQMSNGSTGANNHFAFLGTSAMEGPAADTVTFDPAVVSGARTYNRTTKTCAITCHGQGHDTGMNW